MRRYKYVITTARPIRNLKMYEEELINSIKDFNATSQIARTFKQIDLDSLNIYDDKMEFILLIDADFDNKLSLRPLHLLSMNMLNIDGLNNYAINKRFLKPISIESLNENKTIKEKSDLEVFQLLVSIYMINTKRNSEKREKIRDLVESFTE